MDAEANVSADKPYGGNNHTDQLPPENAGMHDIIHPNG
jgi:hypothetical protein